jgi:hypothetical protein
VERGHQNPSHLSMPNGTASRFQPRKLNLGENLILSYTLLHVVICSLAGPFEVHLSTIQEPHLFINQPHTVSFIVFNSKVYLKTLTYVCSFVHVANCCSHELHDISGGSNHNKLGYTFKHSAHSENSERRIILHTHTHLDTDSAINVSKEIFIMLLHLRPYVISGKHQAPQQVGESE